MQGLARHPVSLDSASADAREGQHLDLEFESAIAVALDVYFAMSDREMGALHAASELDGMIEFMLQRES